MEGLKRFRRHGAAGGQVLARLAKGELLRLGGRPTIRLPLVGHEPDLVPAGDQAPGRLGLEAVDQLVKPLARGHLAEGREARRTPSILRARARGPQAADAGRSMERPIAPGVVVRHGRECASMRSSRAACDCAPGCHARVRTGARGAQRTIGRTFATLAEAVSWAAEPKAPQRAGEHPRPKEAGLVPNLAMAARDVLILARGGNSLNGSRRRFAANAIDSHERALPIHVQELVGRRTGLPLKDLPVDAIDTRSPGDEWPPHRRVVPRGRQGRGGRSVGGRPGPVRRAGPPRAAGPPGPARATPGPGSFPDGPLIAVLIATGRRISEALSLTWGADGVESRGGASGCHDRSGAP